MTASPGNAIAESPPVGAAHRPQLTYIPALDGIRAFAVVSVMLYHLRYSFEGTHLAGVFNCGWVGVDVFFALSGFLITRILLDAKGKPDYFLDFYKRRAFRIWPLYYLIVAIAFFFYWYEGLLSSVTWWAYLTLTQNLFVPGFGMPLLRTTWSLAIEEQFYLVWPVLLRAVSRRLLASIGTTLFAMGPLMRFLFLPSHGPLLMYLKTYTHFDAILLGSLLALWFTSRQFRPGIAKLCMWMALLVGCIGTVVLISSAGAGAQASVFLFSFLALASVGLIGLSVLPAFPLAFVFTWKPVRYIGKISYGIYLFHLQTFETVEHLTARLRLPAAIVILLQLACAVAVAALSWGFFESRIIAMNRQGRSNAEAEQRAGVPC